jgi:hypothetical protein
MAISAAEKQAANRPRVETAEPHASRPARCGEWLPAEMFGAIRSSKRPAFVVQAMLHRPNETMARRESWLRRDVQPLAAKAAYETPRAKLLQFARTRR